MIKALFQFYNDEGQLPLSGKVPDLASSSEMYIQFKEFYEVESKLEAEKFD